MASIELSLVTTGYNEADEIGENLLAMKKALDEYTGKAWELIFVKDGSKDDTEKIVDLGTKIDPGTMNDDR